MAVGSRVTVIANSLDVEAKLMIKTSPRNGVVDKFLIGAGESVLIDATRYINDEVNPDVHLTIWVFVDGFDTGNAIFLPREFLIYGKIIIARHTTGRLKICGVKPCWTDLGRFWGLGFIFGRKYEGDRIEEIIWIETSKHMGPVVPADVEGPHVGSGQE